MRRRLRYAIAPVFCASLMVYAGYHFFEGERGLKAWWALNQEIDETVRELRDVRAARERLEARVTLLREDSLDLDMLEERVRLMLSRGRQGEIVVLYERPIADPH